MKPWTQLAPLSPSPWLPKPLVAKLRKLNTRIEELLAARAACEAERQALAVAQVETIDPAHVAPLEVKAARASDRFGLLQRELVLRRELAEFFEERNAARNKARDEATVAREQLIAQVRQGLVAIGFVDTEVPQRGSITPDMIARHPGIADARQLIGELSADDEHPRLNRDAWAAIVEQLETIRRAAVGPF